jgi:uncharacterized protein YcbK (DUF882 family)
MCIQCEKAHSSRGIGRRAVLKGAAGAALLAVMSSARASEARALSFYHTHTGERLRVTYAQGSAHIPEALQEINRFLRDFRTGDTHPIDPRLLDALYLLDQRTTAGGGTFEIISAFRSPRTNEMLRNRGSAVAERSLHMEGRALDVRLTGVRTARLREEALSLEVGGVGFYRSSDFVHVDTGRVRFW